MHAEQLALQGMEKPTYDDDAIERANETLRLAREWREENPSAWAFAKNVACALIAEGKRVSGRDIVERIRRRDFTDRHGRPTTTNNDFSPVISRWLAAEVDGADALIELRTSPLDEVL